MNVPLGDARLPGITRLAVVCIFVALVLLSAGVVDANPRIGVVTALNSITGTNNEEGLGSRQVVELPSGNLVVNTTWGGRGAVACLTREEFTAGNITISAANALTGSATTHNVGSGGVRLLTNGNYIVLSPQWDNGAVSNVGAVTLVNGETCIPTGETSRAAVVSASNSLIGAIANDGVGEIGVALAGGDYVVSAFSWDNGAASNAGAVTWVDGETGIPAGESAPGVAVSAANSMVGDGAGNQIGTSITALPNGSYVIESRNWDNGAVVNVGAVTWVDTAGSKIGVVSASNSLVGATEFDGVGNAGIVVLTNGSYVVRSISWDNGAATSAGAATWVNGATGIPANESSPGAVVSPANSLVGTATNDFIGNTSVTALANGNYVVASRPWSGNIGAITWGNGMTGTVGAVSAANSLVGGIADDFLNVQVLALTNGNYVVSAPNADINGVVDTGAMTWVNGSTAQVCNEAGPGAVLSLGNSMAGGTASDTIGSGRAVALPGGDFAFGSPFWDNGGLTDAGSVTWGDGDACAAGLIGAANSVVGVTQNDGIGASLTVLTNGHFVVASPNWTGGGMAPGIGAVTWMNGTAMTTGSISAANSIVGATAFDQVGQAGIVGVAGVTALSDGNYVVASPFWDHGAVANVGAATWASGAGPTSLVIGPDNSVIGSQADDQVANKGVVALQNGSFAILSSLWDDGGNSDAHALTVNWRSAVVSSANSLVGLDANDDIFVGGIVVLAGGGFIVRSLWWDSPTVLNAGAITYSDSAITGQGVTFGETGGDTVVTENGSGDTFDVSLSAQPLFDVAVTLTFDGSAMTLNGDADGSIEFTFTPSDWATPQPVTVAAVDDNTVETAETFATSVTMASSDPAYNGLSLSGLGIDVVSDDAGVLFESTPPLLLIEGGAGASYSVVLASEPASDVVIDVTAPAFVALTEGDDPADLTFTAENWDEPQTVTVSPVNDRTVNLASGGNLTHDVTTDDPAYAVLSGTLASITVISLDNDTATVQFDPLYGTAAEGTSPYTATAKLTISGTGTGDAKLGLAVDVVLTVIAGGGTADISDYALVTPTVTFAKDAADGTTQPIELTIINDGSAEPVESLGLLFTPSLTPGVTPSPFGHVVLIGDNDIEMLEISTNGSFDVAGSGKQPAGWKLANGSGDRRVCEHAFAGCTYMFKGGAGENAKLTQKVDIAGMTFTTNDRFDLIYQWDAADAKAKTSFFVTIAFSDGTDKVKFGSTRGQTVGGYVGAFESQEGLPSANVKSITITVQHKSKKGKVYVDELGLFFTQTLTRLPADSPVAAPLPPVDGFRRGQ